MATSDEIGFSGADPLGLGPRPGKADETRPRGTSEQVRGVKKAILDQTNPAKNPIQDSPDRRDTAIDGGGPDVKAIYARLQRLEAMRINPGLGHNAVINNKGNQPSIDLNLVPPEGQGGGTFTPRVIVYSYTPPTPGGPVGADVQAAIETAYNDWGAPYDGSNPLIPQAFDFLAGVNGLNYLVFTDQNFFGSLSAYGYSIIFFTVASVTYTAFSVGGAWSNRDGF